LLERAFSAIRYCYSGFIDTQMHANEAQKQQADTVNKPNTNVKFMHT